MLVCGCTQDTEEVPRENADRMRHIVDESGKNTVCGKNIHDLERDHAYGVGWHCHNDTLNILAKVESPYVLICRPCRTWVALGGPVHSVNTATYTFVRAVAQ